MLSIDTSSISAEVDSKNRVRAIMEKWNVSESLEEVLELQKLQFPKIQIVQGKSAILFIIAGILIVV